MNIAAPPPQGTHVPAISSTGLRLFVAYCRRFVRQRFHAFRILRSALPPADSERPLVVFMNHAGWWDPLVCLLLAERWFRSRRSFAPIDAAALKRYGLLAHLGFFGVEAQSTCGALNFLRTTRAILREARNAVWITPQGRFSDVRERPLKLQPGLGALAARLGNITFLPLAIEYTFWSESRPEMLVAFGEPIVPRDEPHRTAGEWTAYFSDALENTLDELATRSCRRDPAEWLVLERGGSGVNALYDAWRWLRARMQGARFSREHGSEVLE